MEYLLLLISILLSCILLNLGCKLQIFESPKQAVVVLVSLFVIGTVLDSFAVLRGYWSYNENMNFFIGIKIGALPLEEYLFMIVIPYLTLTIFGLVRKANVI
jgi:lycopene cyclase domain-containing protein